MGITQSKKRHEICSICIDEIKETTSILDCGHGYHLKCLDKWLEYASTCPICRAPTKQEQPSDTVTLRVIWTKGSDGSWTRHIRVLTPPYVWRSGPMPAVLEAWIRDH